MAKRDVPGPLRNLVKFMLDDERFKKLEERTEKTRRTAPFASVNDTARGIVVAALEAGWTPR